MSSIHNPRQILDFHVPVSTEHEDGLHLERKRLKEILIEIEKVAVKNSILKWVYGNMTSAGYKIFFSQVL